ncbi:hypothetical protein LSH36_501g01011 [Paralvinella palmiformis]|uniref:Uncharacterized protein n=1 Tax=Paralvinella palmiformis TaxID=53620 RepID=A0AAD9MWT6_9ANNE|nr:hypothetical protein LSH36_501g01011 [Paralvinella palmiformis]
MANKEEPTDLKRTSPWSKSETQKEKSTKKVHIHAKSNKDDESDPEYFDCEYCLRGEYASVIECERCNKWRFPECTNLRPDIHKMLGKSGNLHWYCEVLVKAYGNLTEKEEQIHPPNTEWHDASSTRLKGMMAKLEKRMDDLLVKK